MELGGLEPPTSWVRSTQIPVCRSRWGVVALSRVISVRSGSLTSVARLVARILPKQTTALSALPAAMRTVPRLWEVEFEVTDSPTEMASREDELRACWIDVPATRTDRHPGHRSSYKNRYPDNLFGRAAERHPGESPSCCRALTWLTNSVREAVSIGKSASHGQRLPRCRAVDEGYADIGTSAGTG